MYHYLDRPISTLDLGGRFFVWAIRGWVQAVNHRHCPCRALGDGFARWNAEAGLQSFSMAMAILNCEAREQLYFRPSGHPRIAEHEALLMTLFETVRHRPQAAFRETLAMIVPATSAPSLHIALETAAAAFDAVGLRPSTPEGAA